MIRAVVFGMLLFAGCGSGPCDRLQDICNGCKDANTKKACNDAVKAYRGAPNSDLSCQAAIDSHAYDGC